MPGIKEAKGFFYSLLILGTLVIIASLYSTVWASPSASPSQGMSGQTSSTVPTSTVPTPVVPTPDIVALELAPPVAVPPEGAIKAFGQGVVTNLTAPDGQVSVTIPPNAPKETGFLLYTPKTGADAPAAPPAGLAFGTAIFELTGMDTSGVVASSTSFHTPITILVKYSDADVQAAQGNPSRLVIYKYDSIFEVWTPLTTSVNLADRTVQTKVSSVSFFALMGQAQPPTPTPTPEGTLRPGAPTPTGVPTATLLPPTPGDVAPGSGLLMGLLIAAFIMIAAGSYYLRQSKQT